MRTSLDLGRLAGPLQALAAAERRFDARYPGDPPRRQPVHTVYGGAHRFRADTPAKLGALALVHLERYAPTPATFAAALGVPADALAEAVYERVLAKLHAEPVEDFRIDFEDGYGVRADAEEDADAVRAADALGEALSAGTAPPLVGIRVKPTGAPTVGRALRTLDLFLTRLVERSAVPPRFVVTLPKPRIPEQVAALAAALDALEPALGLAPRTLRVELMIEAPQALLAADGRSPLLALHDAADGRCVGAHFGPYDFTASAQVTAPDQALDHPLCDLARHQMALAFASTGVALSDGPTTALPLGDPDVVHAAWRTMHHNVRRALRSGYFQGWDLHPGQLPVRYAATYRFFLEGLAGATARLANFVAQHARATQVGGTFDDAATGLGLLNWFRRALDCRAIGPAELHAAGLTEDQLTSHPE